MATLTEKEIQLVNKFRQLTQDLNLKESQRQDDSFLVRWIRAREGNLDNAKTMLKKSLEWRVGNNMSEIFNWKPPRSFATLCPLQFLGHNHDNFPVLWVPFGKWNLRQVVSSGEKENFMRFSDFILEQVETGILSLNFDEVSPMTSQNTEKIKIPPQLILVLDIDQLSILTVASLGVVDMILKVTKTFEANYPEILNTVYIINAGRIFSTLLGIVKPFLSERTFGKLEIFGYDPATWTPVLSQAIPNSILPAKYGGSNTRHESFL